MQVIFSPHLQSWPSGDLPSADSSQTPLSRFSAPWDQWSEIKIGWLARHAHTALYGSDMWQVFVGPMSGYSFTDLFEDSRWICLILGALFLTMPTHSVQDALFMTSEEMQHPFPNGCVILDCSHDLHSFGLILQFPKPICCYSCNFFHTYSLICRWNKNSSHQIFYSSLPKVKLHMPLIPGNTTPPFFALNICSHQKYWCEIWATLGVLSLYTLCFPSANLTSPLKSMFSPPREITTQSMKHKGEAITAHTYPRLSWKYWESCPVLTHPLLWRVLCFSHF